MSEFWALFLLGIAGLSFGLLAAAGVFTVFVAVGLIPRFAGKTHTAKYIRLYEDMVVFGTLFGCILSVFAGDIRLSDLFRTLGFSAAGIAAVGNFFGGTFGLFAGIFIGCLALTIAEMLDSIPIFLRRIRVKHGLKIFVFAMALGKLIGSLLYFCWEVHDMVP